MIATSTRFTRFIYLHGFASSPDSFKAHHFRDEFSKQGLTLEVPDLNEPSFTQLTISRQLGVLETLTLTHDAHTPMVIIGSSLGGYTAALFAAQSRLVTALVLMAPAFDLIRRWQARFSSEALARWKRQGTLDVMHYATHHMTPLSWKFVEDGLTHDPFPPLQCPTLIFHGSRDDTVDCQLSIDAAKQNSLVELVVLDDDHSLKQSMPILLRRTFSFLFQHRLISRNT